MQVQYNTWHHKNKKKNIETSLCNPVILKAQSSENGFQLTRPRWPLTTSVNLENTFPASGTVMLIFLP